MQYWTQREYYRRGASGLGVAKSLWQKNSQIADFLPSSFPSEQCWNIEDHATSLSNTRTPSEYSWIICMGCSHRMNKWNTVHDKVDIDLCHSSKNKLYQDVPLHGLNSASRSTEFKEWLIRIGVTHLEGLFLDQGFIEMGSRILYVFAWPVSSWEDCKWSTFELQKGMKSCRLLVLYITDLKSLDGCASYDIGWHNPETTYLVWSCRENGLNASTKNYDSLKTWRKGKKKPSPENLER
jgi:hypothetical protein